jgi:tetratricopeptide (TPR) repeat protein
MTEEFQDLLISLCKENTIPLVRTDSAFIANSPHEITGNELFLEHLHPNVEGYFLMARTFADALRKSNIVFSQSDWSSTSVSDSTLMELSTVSEFDRTLGKLKTDFLKRRWPFNKGKVIYEFNAANPIESLVFKYLQKEIGWSNARYMLADYYAKQRQFDLARKECRAVAKVLPFYYEPLLRVADLYRVEGKREDAIGAYKLCLEVEENPYAYVKLAIISLDASDAATAANYLEAAFRINEHFDEPFSAEAASAGRYLLGLSYANSRRKQEAKEQLNLALAINPNNQNAKELLRQLP